MTRDDLILTAVNAYVREESKFWGKADEMVKKAQEFPKRWEDYLETLELAAAVLEERI